MLSVFRDASECPLTVCSCLKDWPGIVGKQSLSIHTPDDNLSSLTLHPSLVNPSLNVLLFSTCTVQKNIHRHRHSLENVLLTSARVLSVWKSQPSHERLPLLCKRTTLELGLVTWVGSHLRAVISLIAFPLSAFLLFCVILCEPINLILDSVGIYVRYHENGA